MINIIFQPISAHFALIALGIAMQFHFMSQVKFSLARYLKVGSFFYIMSLAYAYSSYIDTYKSSSFTIGFAVMTGISILMICAVFAMEILRPVIHEGHAVLLTGHLLSIEYLLQVFSTTGRVVLTTLFLAIVLFALLKSKIPHTFFQIVIYLLCMIIIFTEVLLFNSGMFSILEPITSTLSFVQSFMNGMNMLYIAVIGYTFLFPFLLLLPDKKTFYQGWKEQFKTHFNAIAAAFSDDELGSFRLFFYITFGIVITISLYVMDSLQYFLLCVPIATKLDSILTYWRKVPSAL